MKLNKLALNLLVISCFSTGVALAGGDNSPNPAESIKKANSNTHAVNNIATSPSQAGTYQIPKFQFSERGLNISTQDDDFVTNIYGYIQMDAMQFFGSSQDLRSNTHLHRAKFELSGRVAHDWGYGVYYDFMTRTFYEGFMSYLGWNNMSLTIGQYGPDFSMANMNSATRIPFLENPLPVSAFAPFYYEGIFYKVHNDNTVFAASAFGPSSQISYTGRMPVGADGRIVYSPIHTEGQVIHLAISEWFQRTDGSKSVSFYTGPEVTTHNTSSTNPTNSANNPAMQLIYTNPIHNVKTYNITDLEAGGVYGPWSLKGEYLLNHLNRYDGNTNANLYGYYATLAYFLTGESELYYLVDGDFNDISAIRHSYGAWQIATQYSYLNLTDEDIKGGKEANATIGLNWYPNKYVTFKFDVIHAYYHLPTTSNTGSTNIFALRGQLRF